MARLVPRRVVVRAREKLLEKSGVSSEIGLWQCRETEESSHEISWIYEISEGWPVDERVSGGTGFLDTQFLHAGSQRIGVKAESRRRALLPFDDPIDLLKDADDMGPFNFF